MSRVPIARPARAVPSRGAARPVRAVRQRGLWADAWLRLRRNRAALVGLAFLAAVVTLALLAELVTPYPPAEQDLGRAYHGPSREHWLGTDQLGRDLLSRLLHGARISVAVGVATQLIIVAIGVPVGAVAGYFGGRIDQLLMRLVDVLYSFPDLLLIIVIMSTLRAALREPADGGVIALLAGTDAAFGGLLGVFVSLGLISWLTVARLVRGQVLSLRERVFIEAAIAAGAGHARIIGRHLVPNTLGVVIVSATFGVPGAILAEAALSFLGLGVQAPMTSWGLLILDGYKALRASPHLILVPAAALSLTVLAFNFLGDGLRDALDPQLR